MLPYLLGFSSYQQRAAAAHSLPLADMPDSPVSDVDSSPHSLPSPPARGWPQGSRLGCRFFPGSGPTHNAEPRFPPLSRNHPVKKQDDNLVTELLYLKLFHTEFINDICMPADVELNSSLFLQQQHPVLGVSAPLAQGLQALKWKWGNNHTKV